MTCLSRSVWIVRRTNPPIICLSGSVQTAHRADSLTICLSGSVWTAHGGDQLMICLSGTVRIVKITDPLTICLSGSVWTTHRTDQLMVCVWNQCWQGQFDHQSIVVSSIGSQTTVTSQQLVTNWSYKGWVLLPFVYILTAEYRTCPFLVITNISKSVCWLRVNSPNQLAID